MGTPIHRKTREVQFTAGGRPIAPAVPLIGFLVSTLLDPLEKRKKGTLKFPRFLKGK